ncbi:MAG TPA: class I SAM-dependent methyltransferase [Chthoniobacterales bacterium]|jgi:ubiquinone/menaquinone biosynthesis C-methylase UbiE
MQSRDTDWDWNEIAKAEPYWGVLTGPQFKLENLTPAALEEFYQAGERDVRRIFDLIGLHLAPSFRPRCALDFGCGVGRMLISIARRSEAAYGVDIADRMLEICEERLRTESIQNVTLVKSDDALSRAPAQFDFLTSFIVFQHIPPKRGYRLLRGLLDRLASSGVFYLHLTFARGREHVPHNTAHAELFRFDESLITILTEVPHPERTGDIHMHDYDLNIVFAHLSQAGIEQMFVSFTDHGGCHGVEICGRKRAEPGPPVYSPS